MRGRTETMCEQVQEMIKRLGLQLNYPKTQLVYPRGDSLALSGLVLRTRFESGKMITLTQPSRHSE